MKIVQINTSCGVGSTGKICVGISQVLTNNNIENYILYSSKSNGYDLGIKCSNDMYIKCQAIKSRLFGNYGFNSKKSTRKIIEKLDEIKPDIVHIHNIHGHDCNLEMLFMYLKNNPIKVIWTFHDCWAFTGYCTYFDMVKCNKWKNYCERCSQRKKYSWIYDNSKKIFEKKRQMFNGIDLTIVTPSKWLADLVKQSFLKYCQVRVINNGIDLNVFKPYNSDFREKYELFGKKIILGIAFGWDKRKGLDVFIKLAQRLQEGYVIVLVGTDYTIDKQLPSNIISVHRTQNQLELAKIYSSADVFVNPTREENYPTVNIEALACGTPVITFDTGGSPEIIDNTCGSVVKCDNIEELEKEIIRLCSNINYSVEACLNRAKEFDKNERFKEYLELYKTII